MPLSQVSSCLSDPIIAVLAVLLPHLAETVPEKAQVVGVRLCIWAPSVTSPCIRSPGRASALA